MEQKSLITSQFVCVECSNSTRTFSPAFFVDCEPLSTPRLAEERHPTQALVNKTGHTTFGQFTSFDFARFMKKYKGECKIQPHLCSIRQSTKCSVELQLAYEHNRTKSTGNLNSTQKVTKQPQYFQESSKWLYDLCPEISVFQRICTWVACQICQSWSNNILEVIRTLPEDYLQRFPSLWF